MRRLSPADLHAATVSGILVGLLLMTLGCAGPAGFDRNAMLAVLRSDSDADVDQPAAAHPPSVTPFALPFKLALYFVDREVEPRHGLHKIQWLGADKETLARWLKSLRDERIVSELFLLTDPTIRGRDVRMIRRAAARYGMDAVLIVDGVGSVDRFNNGYAVLYPTLVGAYFAPGTECDALVTVEGSLWDARAERLYFSHTNDGAGKSVGPTMSVEDRDALATAKHRAFEEFGGRIAERLRAMKADRPRVPDQSR